jgi:hypothetical protein
MREKRQPGAIGNPTPEVRQRDLDWNGRALA